MCCFRARDPCDLHAACALARSKTCLLLQTDTQPRCYTSPWSPGSLGPRPFNRSSGWIRAVRGSGNETRTLARHFAVICESEIDPIRLGTSLFEARVVNAGTRDEAATQGRRDMQIRTLVDAVMRQGRPGAFQTFVETVGPRSKVRFSQQTTQPKILAPYGNRKFPDTVCYRGCFRLILHTVTMATTSLYGCVRCLDCKPM